MKLKIVNIPPYTGEYDITPPYNAREVNTFKIVAGVLPATFAEAVRNRDVGVTVAYAVIALKRAGQQVDPDAIWEGWVPDDSAPASVGRIEIIIEESDAVPPPATQEQRSSGEQTGSSGTSGNPDGDSLPESGQSGTGSPGSAASSASDPSTSET